MALHLPRREPRGPGPNARRHRVRWSTHCSRSTSGRYRNPLDERAAELSDPADVPGAAHLAERLAEDRETGVTVWIEPDRGVDLALLPMLRAVVGDRVYRLGPGERPAAGDFLLRAGSVRPLLLFKALQLLQCRGLADPLQDYVAFDLETTEMDPAECEIVELAAVRVRGRVVVDQFQRLVRPSRPITPRATAVHGYRDADVCDQPTIRGGLARVPRVRGRRSARGAQRPHLRRPRAPPARGRPAGPRRPRLLRHAAARALAHGSRARGLEDLAHRFGVSRGRSHHALDDAATLVGVVRHLGELRLARARKTALVQLLGWLGLALALDAARRAASPEERVLRDLALPAALGRYGGCLEAYAEQATGPDAPSVEELIERLGGERLLERIRTERPVAERYPASVARLTALVEASAAPTLGESIELLLNRVALSRSDGCRDRRATG